MLRSIFSLFQNILDSEKEFKNTKSSTVIYLVSNPDSTVNMDLEIDGKDRENLCSVKQNTAERGDAITCPPTSEKRSRPIPKGRDEDESEYGENAERPEDRTCFHNEEAFENSDSQEPCEEGERMSVRDMLSRLPERHARMLQKDRDHVIALMEQIQKMKTGMERLQEIAQQFNCSEKFKQDIDYLTKNVGPALQKSEREQNGNLEPKKM